MTEIADAVEAAGVDEAVRCAVLRGAGEHFFRRATTSTRRWPTPKRGRRRSRASSA